MVNLIRLAVGAAVGAASMYWLDPASGRRRRARARDQLTSVAASLSRGVRVGGRDLEHRVRGAGAQVRSRFTREDVSDEVLAERVRAAMGRVVSHPGAIDVFANDGEIRLVGAILAREHQQLMHTVHGVRGVRVVYDHLSVSERPDGIPSLQGGGSLRPYRKALLREYWPPALRMVAGVSGTALMIVGSGRLFRHSTTTGVLTSLLGALAVVRSTTNVPLSRLAGWSGRRAIDIRKTIHVQAPVESVFATLSNYERYPSFMRNVRRVQVYDDGRSHWEVAGPAGVTVEWDSQTTAYKPNELLGWRTIPNSRVAHAGIIRFEPTGKGTRVNIQMSYNPPTGALGHAVARIFGADPKKELDEDLLRLKSFLESGVRPRDAAEAHSGRSWSHSEGPATGVY